MNRTSEITNARPSAPLSWKVAAVVGSSALSLALVELILRLFFSSDFYIHENEKNLTYRYDPRLGWFPIPGSQKTLHGMRTISVVHNHDGFRDLEHSKTSDKPRLLFLGDSFVWGFEVNAAERFTDKLQVRHPEWDIYNCGVSGYGTDQEYLLLQQWFDRYRPSLVLLVFCTENDRFDNRLNFRDKAYYKPYFTTNSQGLELQGVPVPRSERSIFSGHRLLGCSYFLRMLVRCSCNLHAQIEEVPDPTHSIIAELQKFLQARGTQLAVGVTATDKSLQRFLSQSGIPCLDLSTTNRFHYDGHWTPVGHDFVCSQIEAFLNSQTYLTKSSRQSNVQNVNNGHR